MNSRIEQQPVVFIIDDDVSLCEALGSLFRSVGLQVQVFGSAPDFLQSSLPAISR